MDSSAHALRLRPAARADIDEIVEHLTGEPDPLLALRFVDSVRATFEHLTFAPKAYPKFETKDGRLRGLRWRPVSGSFARYLVFYRLDDEGWVEVVRIVHSSRELRRILDGA